VEKKDDWKSTLAKMAKVSGYLQTGYNYNSLGSGTSSFQAKRLRLILDGQVCENGSFRLQIEAFNGVSGSTNGNGQKNLQVMDAFFTYKFKPEFQVRAGQFFTPVGFENYNIAPSTLETVDFSNICYRMVCRNAIGYDFVDYGRDLGVMLMGDLLPSGKGFNYLSYNLAVTNGHLPSMDDNNKSKDIIAAVTFRPIEYLNIKGAFNYGEYKDSQEKYNPMNRMVGGFWYDNPNGFDIRAEYGYLYGKREGQYIAKESAFYVLAAYHAGKFLPVTRFEKYHDSIDPKSLNNCEKWLVGCTWNPVPFLKVQLNYTTSFYSGDVKNITNNGKGTSSQFQLMGLFRF
jgi:hypothetical protein